MHQIRLYRGGSFTLVDEAGCGDAVGVTGLSVPRCGDRLEGDTIASIGGSYVIGHGGGATMQHSYCTNISWADAQPGDLVFYPDNSHVGIVGGKDADGELLIIHCASGYNNVVVTGLEGFTSIARPDYYTN